MLTRIGLFVAAALGVVAVTGVLWLGKQTEPSCAEALQELSGGKAPQESRESSYGNTVTCERDCQVTFYRGEEPGDPANAEDKEPNTSCDTPEELDLLAQKQMAHWTAYIAGLTGVGVVLLIGTLLVTQNTNLSFVDSSQRQLRAYLNIRDVVVHSLAGGALPSVVVHYENRGQTPAYRVGSVVTFRLKKRDDPWPEIDFEKTVRSRSVLGPGIPQVCETPADKVAPNDITPLQNGEMEYRVVGHIEYLDAFGQLRHTKFKFFVESRRIRGDAKPISLAAHSEGNEAS